MEQMKRKTVLTGIDGVYIPVSNRKQSEAWYIEHFGLEHGEDYLLAGRQEVFLRERLDQQVLTFRTNQWLENGESYEMPSNFRHCRTVRLCTLERHSCWRTV